jgi:hypothetical protein
MQNRYNENLATLKKLYGLFCDVLNAYFTPPRIPDSEKLERLYLRLYAAIETAIAKPGMEQARQDIVLPFPSLAGSNENAGGEWDAIYRRETAESLAAVERQFYAAGSPGLPDVDKNSDLFDEAKKTLKKYKKAQKKFLKKTRETVLPETKGSAQKPATEDEPIPVVARTGTRNVVEKEPGKKQSTWKTIIIGIIIGIITGTVARLIVYFVTRYLE